MKKTLLAVLALFLVASLAFPQQKAAPKEKPKKECMETMKKSCGSGGDMCCCCCKMQGKKMKNAPKEEKEKPAEKAPETK